MARSAIIQQIRDLEKTVVKYPELDRALKIHRKILEVWTSTEASPDKGVTIDWRDESFLKKLEEQASTSGQPIASLLDPKIFALEPVVQIIQGTLRALEEEKLPMQGLHDIAKRLSEGKTPTTAQIEAFLRNDEERLGSQANQLEVEPSLLDLLFSVGVQPFFEEVARRVSPDLLERWNRRACPVCGRRPTLARARKGKRYLTCSLCGTEYPIGNFLCINCGNGDPSSQRFLQPKNQRYFRVDFCEQCKHYIKVIDEGKLKHSIPRGLEEILTSFLDKMAEEAGLVRSA